MSRAKLKYSSSGAVPTVASDWAWRSPQYLPAGGMALERAVSLPARAMKWSSSRMMVTSLGAGVGLPHLSWPLTKGSPLDWAMQTSSTVSPAMIGNVGQLGMARATQALVGSTNTRNSWADSWNV